MDWHLNGDRYCIYFYKESPILKLLLKFIGDDVSEREIKAKLREIVLALRLCMSHVSHWLIFTNSSNVAV
jgi:hypothetical protein